MPTFRTAPSSSISTSLRNLMRSSDGSLDQIMADQMAARTARDVGLAEKARLEAEAMRRIADPKLRTEFASHAAGINVDDGSRLANHIRGVLEQPAQADIDDADRTGTVAEPFRTAAPVLQEGQEGRFRSAMAAQIASMIATGKTNADQLLQAAGQAQDNALVDQASRTTSVPDANRIIAAVSRKVREPFTVTPQGVVLNQESGTIDESSQLASAARNLLTARGGTEGARTGELNSRSERNRALAELARARAQHVRSGKSATPLAPERVTRMIDMSAAVEFRAKKAAYDALPLGERKKISAPTYDAVRTAVEKRYRGSGGQPSIEQDTDEALQAIANGADIEAVRQRYRQRWGVELEGALGDE